MENSLQVLLYVCLLFQSVVCHFCSYQSADRAIRSTFIAVCQFLFNSPPDYHHHHNYVVYVDCSTDISKSFMLHRLMTSSHLSVIGWWSGVVVSALDSMDEVNQRRARFCLLYTSDAADE